MKLSARKEISVSPMRLASKNRKSSSSPTGNQGQYLIMKPTQVITQYFEVHATSDQAARYACNVIPEDSDLKEIDSRVRVYNQRHSSAQWIEHRYGM
ncbi:protein HAPLESS 2-A-like [Helianthus annuus]|uniref:protein HAPLESS 2-A-like n=1 Tax=Helianthus annuus TaxID=4232 RepID=UPI000B9014BC|nr:protein HAPLESS 2-A-like [Helianthus annuus]